MFVVSKLLGFAIICFLVLSTIKSWPMLTKPAWDFQTIEDIRRIHSGGQRDQHVRVAMTINKPDRGFCQSLYSQLALGFEPPFLLNFGKNFPHKFGEKILRAKELLESQKANDLDLFLFTDGSDLIFQLPEREFIRNFDQINTTILFSAEKNCYPYDKKACNNLPNSTLPQNSYGRMTDTSTRFVRPKYVNSGAIIGNRDNLRILYEWATKIVLSQKSSIDQLIMQQYYSQEWQKKNTDLKIGLDYRSVLFQSLWESISDISWEVNPNPRSPSGVPSSSSSELKLDLSGLQLDSSKNHKSFWFGRPLARNKLTNTIPAILHFNGDKEYREHWWGNFWFNQPGTYDKVKSIVRNSPLPGQAGAWDGDNWLSWDELCEGFSI